MVTEILKIEGEYKTFTVDADTENKQVTVWIDEDVGLWFDLNQEETLMVSVALMDALKEVWPEYGELEDIVTQLMEAVEDETDNEDE